MLSSQLTYLGPIWPNDIFYCSFTQVRGKLSMFFHYVDLEYDVILSNDLIAPISQLGLMTSFIALSLGKLFLFFHYVDLEYEAILSNDLIGSNWPNDLFYRSFTQVRGKLSLFFPMST